MREFEVTLGGQPFKMKPLTLGQLERITEITIAAGDDVGAKLRVGFKVFRIALERAEPKIEDVDNLEITKREFEEVLPAIMRAAGLAEREPEGEALPPAAGAV